ncbi:MAG: hypothetical protein AW08_00634 [Candidatus Accumulibacter adjunctus]|uniref:DUF1631 family protein n=1 Tax=Candidatus Accumulibacter adjunctus TaxID=1454001 RepID=A0A011NXQ3_9PROT|nr:MAG: hypothetical protein AW08_00634 [Candidatus Accumulibacter adjunctus]
MPPHEPPSSRPGERQLALTRASREILQRRLGDVVRICAAHSPAAAEAFEREVGEAHDELLSTHSDDDFGQASELTASRLTLMGDDDLELDIRIRNVGSRLREAGGRALSRCQSRYRTLLGWAAGNDGDEPLGPEVICLGLWALSREAARSLEEALTLLDRIEQRLLQQLPLIYGEIDDFLASQGVEAAPTERRQKADTGTVTAPSPRSPASLGQTSSSALQDFVRQQTAGTPTASAAPLAGDDSLQACRPALDTAALVMLQHLLARLTALETHASAAEATATGTAAPRSQDLDLPAGRPEAVIIDTMALIFEAMFESDELPDVIRAAVGNLQIPLLKVALVDPALLASETHPARLLLNRIGHAALGLPRDAPSGHPLCARLCRLAATARAALGRQPIDLDSLLADLAALIDERERAIRASAAPYEQMVRAHESRRYASQLAATWLRTSLARTHAAEIAAFLETYWLRVMIAAGADGGPNGERWQQHSRTADDLIWSVLPKQGPDERKRLAGMASSLLKRIADGLDGIGISAAERKPFLERLFDLQTAALRNQSAAAPAGERTAGVRPTGRFAEALKDVAGSGAQLLEDDGRQVRYLAGANSERPPQAGAAAGLQVGEWLRFSLPDAATLCGLSCWLDPAGATILLFNPDWIWAVAAHRSFFDRQIAIGEARIVSRVCLFDAAAERALRRLGGG